MSLISPVHILFVAAFALIFLGPKRLPEAARSLGAGMRVFRDALNGEAVARGRLGALDAAGAQDPGAAAPAPRGPAA